METEVAAIVHNADPVTAAVIGSAIAVHRALGPGLLESAYQACLAAEFAARGVPFEREVPVPLVYRGVALDCGYRLDFVVSGAVIVETKAVEAIVPVHEAQLLTYLKLTGLKRGLILNFNAHLMQKGIKRMVL